MVEGNLTNVTAKSTMKFSKSMCAANDAMKQEEKEVFQSMEKYINLDTIIPINLKRYTASYDRHTNSVQTHKNSVTVYVPAEFSVTEYISEISIKSYTLVLQSAVLHVGSTVNSGHYVSYVKEKDTDAWYFYDDLEKPVLVTNQFTMLKAMSANAYLLFYKLIEN